MILHCVFCSFRPEVSDQDRLQAVQSFQPLVSLVEGLVSIQAGPNEDFENKSKNHSHGFVATFKDKNALNEYAAHPLHQQLGAALVAKCAGGADGILVYDLEVDE